MKCCICGTVKNCAPYLNKVFENMEKIGGLFEDYFIILYYDTSNDDTLNILKDYKIKNNKMIFYVNQAQLSEERTHNIAKGRNYCLEYIRQNLEDYEFFVMMDCDDVNCKNCDTEVLRKYLHREDWDALSFNTIPDYYDIWALSIYPYYLSLFHWSKKDEYTQIIYYNIQKIIANVPSGELITCASSFNGFAIYRSSKFLNCSYDGRLRIDLLPFKKIFNKNNVLDDYFDTSLNYDCEHRSFHFEAINKNDAKIRISSDILFK